MYIIVSDYSFFRHWVKKDNTVTYDDTIIDGFNLQNGSIHNILVLLPFFNFPSYILLFTFRLILVFGCVFLGWGWFFLILCWLLVFYVFYKWKDAWIFTVFIKQGHLVIVQIDPKKSNEITLSLGRTSAGQRIVLNSLYSVRIMSSYRHLPRHLIWSGLSNTLYGWESVAHSVWLSLRRKVTLRVP